MTGPFDDSYMKEIRKKFPRIERDFKGRRRIFVDNGAGSLVLEEAARSEMRSRIDQSSNTDALYSESKANEMVISEGRKAVADLLNAPDEKNIYQGESASDLFFKVSYSLRGIMDRDSNVVSTYSEHFANVSPYLEMKRNNSISELRLANIDRRDGSIDINHLGSLVNGRTKMIAVTAESNLLGNKTKLEEISRIARENDSLLMVDGVHFAPQGYSDVRKIGCDFFVFSSYKIFGPRGSFMYMADSVLDVVKPYHVDREANPGTSSYLEIGTRDQGIFAAITSVVNYISRLSGSLKEFRSGHQVKNRRIAVRKGMERVERYHDELCRAVLDGTPKTEGLNSIKNVVLYGIPESSRSGERGTTFSFNFKNVSDRKAEEVYWKKFGITVVGGSHWNLAHDYYENPSMLRATFLHYNTISEVEKFLSATRWISSL
ncbi:MAG: aminotransferase class V-fold PLP-dependent enzyme [Candidatus Thermoplasmatota archaeon]|nr:aminotransferase class V-fold PLP-dependent enzyme [Candidatus Thermoplasmatota archaeon]MCL5789031.1 aminotransferase class V-fold PLP-dependent enzyme [Candidatus Thermoplasmatota archaeon]